MTEPNREKVAENSANFNEYINRLSLLRLLEQSQTVTRQDSPSDPDFTQAAIESKSYSEYANKVKKLRDE
jgi:hypothetical protein